MKNLILKTVLAVFVATTFSGCFVATKTKELGGQMTNTSSPIVWGTGAVLYGVGRLGETITGTASYDSKDLNISETETASFSNNVEEDSSEDESEY